MSEYPTFRFEQKDPVTILKGPSMLHFGDFLETQIAVPQSLANICRRWLVSPREDIRNHHKVIDVRISLQIHSCPMCESLGISLFMNVVFELPLELLSLVRIDILESLQVVTPYRN